jgi:hypothetical protein
LEKANFEFEKYLLQDGVLILQEEQQKEGQGQSQDKQKNKQTKTIDVFGQQTEPICNYHTCHHKFSVHGNTGSHVCKCRHPSNHVTGVSRYHQ